MNNKVINKIHNIIEAKMGKTNKHFLNMMVFNKLSQIATHMHICLETWDGAYLPCNFYGIALAPSGFNKGRINKTLQDNVFKGFRTEYDEFSNRVSADNMSLLAEQKAIKEGIDQEEAMDILYQRWKKLPDKLYDFSDATEAGLKGAREKYTMAGIGGTCMQIDEIAYNIEKFEEVVGALLEAYDFGESKDKLIKVDSNGATGAIPASLFMFGSPSALLNGSKTEEKFMSMLIQGYARRMFFSYIKEYAYIDEEEPMEILNRTRSSKNTGSELLSHFTDLATDAWHKRVITCDDTIYCKVIEYEQLNKRHTLTMKVHQEAEKFEVGHRHWKLFKLMGLLAMAEHRDYVTMDDFNDALEVVHDSGQCFNEIVNREPNYVRLFNFMVDMDTKLTEADLFEHLYFYSSSNQAQRKDMRTLAMAYAYSQNGFIRETSKNGVIFYEAEVMRKTDLNKLRFSYSTDIAKDYRNEEVKWDELKQFFVTPNFHYAVHHFNNGTRNSESVIEGFNLLVLDIDDGLPIDMARSLLNEYTYFLYTTKRHTEDHNRFRIVLPLSNIVKLNDKDYKKFMENIFAWLPFSVDTATKDISRKWLTNNGQGFSNNGVMLDPTDFIPDTSNEKEHKRKLEDLGDLDGIEKFFISQIEDGTGRSNTLIKYALMLLDGGMSYENIEDRVVVLNDKLDNPLGVQEIMKTIMVTVRKRMGDKHD